MSSRVSEEFAGHPPVHSWRVSGCHHRSGGDFHTNCRASRGTDFARPFLDPRVTPLLTDVVDSKLPNALKRDIL